MESITPGSADESYDKQQVIDYLEATGDADIGRTMGKDCEVSFRWEGNNRREVFVHLLEHGWAVTSASDGYIWLEQLDKTEDAPDAIWKAPRTTDPFPEDSYPDLDVVRQAEVDGVHYLMVPEGYEGLVNDEWAGNVVEAGYTAGSYADYDELAEAYVEAAE
jgi:hypothetical protein